MTSPKAPRGSRLLAMVAPELAAQFVVERNAGIDLATLSAGSPKKVWWVGLCGHEWESSAYNRLRGQGCPFCAGSRVLTGFNDLATLRPDLAAEWHPIKNGDVLPSAVSRSSGKKAWWFDSLGHEWETNISGRANGSGCPFCAGVKLLPGFNDLATKLPDLAAEWHPTRNDVTSSEVPPKSGSKAWWLCPDGHEWFATIRNRAYGNGCPVCRVPRGEEFAAEKRRRRAEGKPVRKRVVDSDRLSQGLVPGHNDMTTTHPKLAAEFHPFKNAPFIPSTVVAGTGKKIWWQCLQGHEWETTGNSRASMGTGCPTCAGQRILVGYNDLATVRPDIAAGWHPTKNGLSRPSEVTVSNGKKAWWLADCGHEWEAVISSRTGQGVGCPVCANRRTLSGYNDLASLQPRVADSWHPTKNGDVSPSDVNQYSNSMRWWLCEQSHEWKSTVSNRSHGQGCPSCSEGGGFKPSKPGYVYFLEHRTLRSFKVGITNVGTQRLAQFKADGWTVLHTQLFDDGGHALAVEGAIKHWWRVGLGLPMWLGPEDMIRTNGWTETVHSDELTALECIGRIRSEAELLRNI
ncbi:zinc-ribbon domain-containing protein [Arthrobacter sp. 4R501]|uniref:zinc-ribbon domain-containing protein n=1 Tax=Arthrobacter sp. 4R501 TaxID=2058886 RepID=UPI000CE3783C|nr:zinc-ribbon domain-containing protein [Arthrobacter sp. 4R501]